MTQGAGKLQSERDPLGYYCFRCYGLNGTPTGPCVHCGGEIAPPADLSLDDRLMWTLRHPDADRAIAARALGARRSAAAASSLADIVLEPPDPFFGRRGPPKP